MKRLIPLFVLAVGVSACFDQSGVPTEESLDEVPSFARKQATGDPEVLAFMNDMNDQLEAMGFGIRVEAIDYFTIGQGRPSNRIHQQPFRWAAGDPRRLAQGDDITHVISGAPATGVGSPATEDAIRRSITTWDGRRELRKLNIAERLDPGGDITIFDFFIGAGGFGNPFAADIVSGGWMPPGAPWFGPNTLAFSVSFIFTSGGVPTDINGDNYLDTALNEVYYNDGFNWGINGALPQIDVETVALHENGHSFGIGHFGPAPNAVMNPIYAGIRQSPFPADDAGMATIWNRWPN